MPLQLWRLYRAQHGPGLDGIGGTFANGRWHRQGELVVYFGASAAIVVLERLAHIDPDLLPDDLYLGQFEFSIPIVPTDLCQLVTLPQNWARDEQRTRRFGGNWLREGSSSVLTVPSAILPEESNFVFNPRHADGKLLYMVRERPFKFDPRLV